MSRADRTNDTHWVYICRDADDRVIYVGSTTNLFGRLASHRAGSWWSPTISRVTSKVYPNGIVARAEERAAIEIHMPRWNKVGKWGTRSRWTQDDWHDWITLLLRGSNNGRALGYPTPELRRAVADYIALFQAKLPAHLADAVAALEAAGEEREVRQRSEMLQRRRDVERRDELALAREKRDQKGRRTS